jgi:hypothetical protein
MKAYLIRKIVYAVLVVFFIWLAFATRKHHEWFCQLLVIYGGDVIWAGMFLLFLRIFFAKVSLWKLAIVCYLLGAADEFTQMYHAPWIDNIRRTVIGGALLGHGFLWSDIVCYAVGTVLAIPVILFIEYVIIPEKGGSGQVGN